MNQLIIFCAADLIFLSVVYVVFRIFLSHEKRHQLRNVIIIVGTAVVAWVIAHVLKGVIMHPRPDLAYSLIIPDDKYSFPSGHATFMFALSFAMYHFDKYAGRIVLILALFTGVARVLAGVHFWYDIVGGFILGGFIAFIILQILKRVRR